MLALLLLGSLFGKTFRQILSNLLLLLHLGTLDHGLDGRERTAAHDQDDAVTGSLFTTRPTNSATGTSQYAMVL